MNPTYEELLAENDLLKREPVRMEMEGVIHAHNELQKKYGTEEELRRETYECNIRLSKQVDELLAINDELEMKYRVSQRAVEELQERVWELEAENADLRNRFELELFQQTEQIREENSILKNQLLECEKLKWKLGVYVG